MEIYALAILIGLILAALRVSKGSGYKEAEKDSLENDAKILQKQRDSTITNVADALKLFKRK